MTIRDHMTHLMQLAQKPKTIVISGEDELITVSSATKRIAFAYERFRNVLEPDEADILRRKAIYRILERRLLEDKNVAVTAKLLLQELIRASYIPAAPVSFIPTVAHFIQRIGLIWDALPDEGGELFLRIAAVAIDRQLYPRHLEEGIAHSMYQDVSVRAVWADDLLPEEDRLNQLFMACHRALFAADDYEIFYHFFTGQYPTWFQAETDHVRIAKELPAYLKALSTQVHHPARERLQRLMKPVAVPYRILLDLVQSKTEEIFNDDQALQAATRAAIEKRTRHIESRMGRRAWHAILFLLFTKTFIALFLELPYELFILGSIHWLALSANILFHPFLLFVAGTTVKMPGESNTERIIEQVTRIVSGEEVLPTILIQRARRYGAVTWSLFATVYTALFLLIFWRLFLFLDQLEFSIIAILIFVVFLGLVSFLATRIRRSVNDIRVIPRREGFLAIMFSFLSLPILEFGRFLTAHVSQLNVILFVMDLLLEAPFKLIIDVVEEWFTFIRDRKEEIA